MASTSALSMVVNDCGSVEELDEEAIVTAGFI
jgi:hypothetical protein